MNVDLKTTHGLNYKVVTSLENILSNLNDPVLNRSIHSAIQNFMRRLNALSSLVQFKTYYRQLTLEETKKKIKARNYPLLVETHLLCVLKAIYRDRYYAK